MKWFYTLKNHVKGPYSNEEFETALTTLGPDIKDTLVWTRGKADWTEAERWTVADADKIQAQAQSAAVMQSLAHVKVDPSVKNDATKTVEVAPADRHPPKPVAVASPETAPKAKQPPAPAPKTEVKPKAATVGVSIPAQAAPIAAPLVSPSAQSPSPVTPPKINSQPAQPPAEKKSRQATSVTAISPQIVQSVQPAPLQAQPKPKPQPAAAPIKPVLDLNLTVKKPTPVQDVILPTDDEITKLFGAAPADVIQSVKETVDEKYKVQYNGAEQAPMTKAQLIEFTGRQEDPSLILIFNKKQNDWKEIYTFPDIIEKLGLSRRQNRRVTLLANFKGKINNAAEINARLTTISLGGFGLTDVFDLKIGDSVKGQIASPHFYTPIAIEGEVTYAGSHGGIGLKFTAITDEARALVIDYIKKFGQGVKTEDI